MKIVEMPKLGDTMEEGKILRWLKKEGDQVKKGDSLAEIETEKVNIDVEAFASGVLRKILVPEGTSALVGAGIALVGAPDEPLPASASNPGGTGAAEATRPATNTQAEKASRVGQTAATPPTNGLSSASIAVAISTLSLESRILPERGRIFISPIARRLAEEYHFDYTTIQGTGPNGRIIKMDVEVAIAAKKQSPVAQTAPVLPTYETYLEPAPEAEEVLPIPVGTGDVIEIPLTAMRRTIAKRLTQSMQTAPHFYVTSVIDTSKFADLRQQINEYAANSPSPVKVSYNDLIIKAVARSLVLLPQMNVSFAEDRILQKKQVHIGVAVALEQGLIVPVVRNADQLGILDLARETQRLAEAARAGKLRPEDFSGGTFTVSNLGMFDVDSFTAVINPPESAILAIGSITPTPVVVDGQIVVRDRMKVTLSSDHRAIDGATAARFLQEVRRLLEEPFGLLL